MDLLIQVVVLIILIIALFKFFGMASDISNINRMMVQFTKYYYESNDYRLKNKQ